MEVEYLNDMLVYLVTWLFGGLHHTPTMLPVIVSVYRRATLRKTTRLGWITLHRWLVYFILEGQPFRSGPASEYYWACDVCYII